MATTPGYTTTTPVVKTGPGTVSVDLTGQLDDNQSILVLPDGKILVGGYTEHLAWGYPGAPGEESIGYDLDRSVVRLNADGSLDTTFGEGGVHIVSAGIDPEWEYEVMSVQTDGKVLAATSVDGGVRVERYDLNGALDLTFGNNGAMLVSVGHVFNGIAVTANVDGTLNVSARGSEHTTVARLDNEGSMVPIGDSNGALILDTVKDPINTGGISTAVEANGSVLLGGIYHVDAFPDDHQPGDPVYTVQRFTSTGELDTRFGDNGIVYFDPTLGLRDDSAVTAQADGKVIIVGQSVAGGLTNVLRLNADGSFDTTFGQDGRLILASDSATSVTVQADGKILVAGRNDGDFDIVRFNADGSLDSRFGSPDGKLHIDGYGASDILQGGAGAEIIHGQAGDDVLQGNGGRDVLSGGAGEDIFRFTDVGDSYRTATLAASDRILDFDASEDRIDLIGLGFTGIGNGHNGTLAVKATADGSVTYLKSFEADAAGHRFELALVGNFVGQLDSNNLVLTAPTEEGTSANDTINGSGLSEIIKGLAGNDRINGGAGADVIIGGAGADQLDGGDRPDIDLWTDNHQNDDVFRYTSREDSYRTDSKSYVDLIVKFVASSDKIDVSALGYTALGDGTGSTLKVAYDPTLDRTYLKDLETDAQGHRFEIALKGNWQDSFYDHDMVFAPVTEVSLVGAATNVDQSHILS